MIKLETENANLHKYIEQFKAMRVHGARTAELRISGIPDSCKLELRELTRRIFVEIKVAPNIMDEAISYRKIIYKKKSLAQPQAQINDEMSRNNAKQDLKLKTFTYVVKFRSVHCCDVVRQARHKYGVLDYSKLFANSVKAVKSKVNIYEMLGKYTYDLLKKAEVRAAEKNYTIVWPQEGCVRVRKKEKAKILYIVTEDDLRKIK